MDPVLDLAGNRRWAIEVKRNTAPTLKRGFHHAYEDLAPERAFVVYPGINRYPLRPSVAAIRLRELTQVLQSLASRSHATRAGAVTSAAWTWPT